MDHKNSEKVKKWLWLSLVSKISKGKVHKLISVFENIDNIYNAQREDYEKLTFLKSEDVEMLCNKNLSIAEKLLSDFEKLNIFVLTKDMPDFPGMLEKYSNHPSVLYCKGKKLNLNKYISVSVVGTRHPGQYGKNVTYSVSARLAEKGVLIVSGMAEGSDSIAHEACLDAGVPTIAVVGSGPDIVYPASNYALASKICEKGMIISEYPPGTKPEKFHFPERNKIIASLSPATVVTEAAEKSGSLITAEYAKKFKNVVFAVPGNITSNLSNGTNVLIAQGAIPISSQNDVYAFFSKILGEEKLDKYLFKNNFSHVKNPYEEKFISNEEKDKEYFSYSDDNKENIIIKCLCGKILSIDKISYETGLSISDLNTALLLMEIKGMIKKCPGDTYTAV